jgi:Domain of unknown function (DUF4136)
MKQNQTLFFASLIFIIAVAASCSTPLKVTSDYDKNASFTQYKTFAMDTFRVSSSLSQLNQNRIINAVRAEMIKKGFTESGTPDLLIHISAIFEKQKSVTASTNYYGYGGYYRPYGWGGGMGATGYTTYNVQDYVDGSLIFDIADAKTKNLLWEGIGNKEIDQEVKDPDTAIPAAVAKIMESFPPGTVKPK